MVDYTRYILVLYIFAIVALCRISAFMNSNLKNVALAKEKGATFEQTKIANPDDILKCDIVQNNTSALNSMWWGAILLILIQSVVMVYLLGWKVPRLNLGTNVTLFIAAVTFILFLFVIIPLSVLVNRMRTRTMRVTDNTNDYDCISFNTKSSKDFMTGIITFYWFVIGIQVFGIVIA